VGVENGGFPLAKPFIGCQHSADPTVHRVMNDSGVCACVCVCMCADWQTTCWMSI